MFAIPLNKNIYCVHHDMDFSGVRYKTFASRYYYFQNKMNTLNLISAAFVLLLSLHAMWRIRWGVLRAHPHTLHIFFAASLILTLLAMMRIGTQNGLALHLSGMTAATLIMGRRLALLAGCLAQIFLAILGWHSASVLGVHGVVQVVLPVYISYGFCRLLQKFLPHNPFIFTLGAGFFGGILALAGVMLATALVAYAGGLYPAEVIWDKYLKFLPVIIYPEGFLNGVIITAMVAFHADLISAFNPKSYFNTHKTKF